MLATFLIVVTPFTFDKSLEDVADGRPFIERWIAAHEDVTSIHATFERRDFDDAFRVARICQGELTYFARKDASMSIDPFHPHTDVKHISRHGVRYLVEPQHRGQIQFTNDWYSVIDHVEKSVFKIELTDDLKRAYGWFWKLRLTDFDAHVPFLPRFPNATGIENWIFKITRETATQIEIQGIPVTGPHFDQMHSCKMVFNKSRLALTKLTIFDWGISNEIVYEFESVTPNPTERPAFDFTGYKVDLVELRKSAAN